MQSIYKNYNLLKGYLMSIDSVQFWEIFKATAICSSFFWCLENYNAVKSMDSFKKLYY